jgi:hypothetical protein
LSKDALTLRADSIRQEADASVFAVGTLRLELTGACSSELWRGKLVGGAVAFVLQTDGKSDRFAVVACLKVVLSV